MISHALTARKEGKKIDIAHEKKATVIVRAREVTVIARASEATVISQEKVVQGVNPENRRSVNIGHHRRMKFMNTSTSMIQCSKNTSCTFKIRQTQDSFMKLLLGKKFVPFNC